MDTLKHYQEIVCNVLCEYANVYRSSRSEIHFLPLLDLERHEYAVVRYGWDGKQRVHSMIAHLSIIDGKVWIQYDGTSPGIALDLVAAGIPREDIVLGFLPARVRQYSDYGVG